MSAYTEPSCRCTSCICSISFYVHALTLLFPSQYRVWVCAGPRNGQFPTPVPQQSHAAPLHRVRGGKHGCTVFINSVFSIQYSMLLKVSIFIPLLSHCLSLSIFHKIMCFCVCVGCGGGRSGGDHRRRAGRICKSGANRGHFRTPPRAAAPPRKCRRRGRGCGGRRAQQFWQAGLRSGKPQIYYARAVFMSNNSFYVQ